MHESSDGKWTVETWPPTDENISDHVVSETFAVIYRTGNDIAVLCHKALLPEFVGTRFLFRDSAQTVADRLN